VWEVNIRLRYTLKATVVILKHCCGLNLWPMNRPTSVIHRHVIKTELRHCIIHSALAMNALQGCCCYLLKRWVHTCNVTVYRNTVSWQCGRDSWLRNVSKVGYAVTLRACSACCRYLAVASKGWYGYCLSRSGRATWHVTTAALFSFSLKRSAY